VGSVGLSAAKREGMLRTGRMGKPAGRPGWGNVHAARVGQAEHYTYKCVKMGVRDAHVWELKMKMLRG
jgi:hypothetical protein